MENSLLEKIDKTKVPNHIAIIMDGNGRWAQKRGEDRVIGHMNGVNSVRQSVEAAIMAGVKYLTLYAFSTENWQRPKEEVDALLNLFITTTLKELSQLIENGIRLESIGDRTQLPSECRQVLEDAIEQTKSNTKLTLVLAINYSAKQELNYAIKNIAGLVKKGDLDVEDICNDTISNNLYTKNIPDPDLLIRTSGEQRLSNFLLWQLAYAEFYFTEILWPDFDKEGFFDAILTYQNRERRFGKTTAQLKN